MHCAFTLADVKDGFLREGLWPSLQYVALSLPAMVAAAPQPTISLHLVNLPRKNIKLSSRGAQERQPQPGKPALGGGTTPSFPSAETIAQVAGLFPKDGPPPSPGRPRAEGADAVWSELLEATSTPSRQRCQVPPCASVRTTAFTRLSCFMAI